LYPKFTKHIEKEFDLDVQVAASGFTKKHQEELEEVSSIDQIPHITVSVVA
jgi:RIO kinase 2